jgi:hypothetical protein
MIFRTDLVQGHAILNQQGYSGIEKTNVAFEHKILFRLGRNASFEIPQTLLGWKELNGQGEQKM